MVPEPVDQWQNVNGQGGNMLQQFYDDPQRYAYTFQNYVFITRVMQVCHMPKQPSYKCTASQTCSPTTETLAPHVPQLLAELRRGS